MGKYYFDRSKKVWRECFPDTDVKDEKLLKKLRDASKSTKNNKHFLVIDGNRRFIALNTKKVYIDIDCIKLVLKDGAYAISKDFSERSIYFFRDILNPKILENIISEFRWVEDYIDVMFFYPTRAERLNKLTKEKALSSLLPEDRLAYEAKYGEI